MTSNENMASVVESQFTLPTRHPGEVPELPVPDSIQEFEGYSVDRILDQDQAAAMTDTVPDGTLQSEFPVQDQTVSAQEEPDLDSVISSTDPETHDSTSFEDASQDEIMPSQDQDGEQEVEESAPLDQPINAESDNGIDVQSTESLEQIGLLLLSTPTSEQILSALQDLQALQISLQNSTSFDTDTLAEDDTPSETSEGSETTISPLDSVNATENTTPTSPGNPSVHFLELRTEIRDLVYGHLLVNSILGNPSSVSRDASCGARVQYNLSPQALRVGKQMYREGLHALYTLNTFFAFCSESYTHSQRDSSPLWSPLNRYSLMHEDEIFEVPLHERYGFSLVKRWDVLINTRSAEPSRNDVKLVQRAFGDFCQAIFTSHAEQIILRLIPKMLERGSDRADYLNLDALKRFASMLRVPQPGGKFALGEAEFWQVGDDHLIRQDEDFDQLYPANEDWCPVAESELFSLVVGSSPAEATFKMYPQLLKYAQCFELFLPFKLEMDFGCESSHTAKMNDLFVDFDHLGRKNPFRGEWSTEDATEEEIMQGIVHPVERGLISAKGYSAIEELEMFKIERGTLLAYLEPQYQKIFAAAVVIDNFVRAEKVDDGFLNAYYDHPFDKIRANAHRDVELVLLVETFGAAFTRDMPMDILLKIRPWKKTFDSLYAALPVFKNIRRMTTLYEERNIEAMITAAQKAISALMELFMEMRAARRVVFAHDYASIYGCDIVIEDDHDFEEFDWNVNYPTPSEPDFETPSDLRSDSDSDDDSSHGSGADEDDDQDHSDQDHFEPDGNGDQDEVDSNEDEDEDSSHSEGEQGDDQITETEQTQHNPDDLEPGHLSSHRSEGAQVEETEDTDIVEGDGSLNTELQSEEAGDRDGDAIESEEDQLPQITENGAGSHNEVQDSDADS